MFFFFPDGIAPQGDIIIYQSDNDNMTTNVLFKDETFWMSQKEIALLFGVDRTVISKHLKNVFANQELDENSADEVLITAGKALYQWADLESGNIHSLRIRERVTEPYVVRGGFHILANSRPLPKVFWHPHFLNRVGQLLGAQA